MKATITSALNWRAFNTSRSDSVAYIRATRLIIKQKLEDFIGILIKLIKLIYQIILIQKDLIEIYIDI